jgi:hypothetical protein
LFWLLFWLLLVRTELCAPDEEFYFISIISKPASSVAESVPSVGAASLRSGGGGRRCGTNQSGDKKDGGELHVMVSVLNE